VKYAWIGKHRHRYPLDRLCRVLDVARSGFHGWVKGHESGSRKQQDQTLLAAIRAAHERGRGVCGPLKIQAELAATGLKAGLNRIKRLRRQHGIRCKQKRKFKATTDSRHNLPIAPNLLEQRFDETTAPNQVWVADITYVPTDEGWLYLAGIKDLHTCELVGWSMGERMTKALVMEALRAAWWKKKPKPGLIHHSDRGSQYCSEAYRNLQAGYGIKTSMSRKGNCWDNAPMESFFGSLKTESLHHYRFATREAARRVVFDYIEVFYNRIRRHAKLGYLAPAEFVKRFYAHLEKAA